MTPALRLEATRCSGPSVGLGFALTSTAPGLAKVWSPVTPWQLRVFADGDELAVARPPLDLPAALQIFSVGPGRQTRIPCPVLLVFGEDGAHGDGLVWTIHCLPPPSSLEIECGLEIDGVGVPAPRVRIALGAVP